jgi:hypothetical protein
MITFKENIIMPKEQVDLTSMVVQAGDVLVSKIDDEVVMMSIANGTYSGLDVIGSEIWNLLASPKRVSEICDLLLERYEVDRDRCEADVLSFLNDLVSDNVIKVVNAPE